MNDAAVDLLVENVSGVLSRNNRERWTIPAEGLYPHQWLWDSCFIAIGLSHLNVNRAKTEILSLLRGQWSNGMLPHMIFADGDEHRRDREIWRSYLSPYAPENVYTSGITQPPIIAEAVIKIGEKMKIAERRSWYQTVYPALVRYHQWLYLDRDPHNEGLTVCVHPWETGLDNSPPWIHELYEHRLPLWIALVDKLGLDKLIDLVRRDTHFVNPGQRISNIEALAFFSSMRRLRRKAYDTNKILTHSIFTVEDVAFNSILIRTNQHLQKIAKTIDRQLPEDLQQKIKLSENALDSLWDASSGKYYCRNFVTHKLIPESYIGSLLPLYSGAITKERAEQLVNNLRDKREYWTNYPIPSVPKSSSYYNPVKFWQGPTWLNTNWLIIDGLNRYGYKTEANFIRQRSLELISKSDSFEYFNPETGDPAGAAGFSWTAALTIDLVAQEFGI